MSFDTIYELSYSIKVPDMILEDKNMRMKTVTTKHVTHRFNFVNLRKFLLENLNNHEIKIESLHKDNNYSPNKFIVLFTIISPNITADNYISHYKLLETINGPDTFSLNDDDVFLCNLLCP
jgi:hypothetical protein